MNPKISVIVPLYNKENAIAATIQSVLKQTYKDFELIVVDDGSTDASVEKVLQFNDSRIRLLQKENGGVSSARNFGIHYAKTDWIFLLDGDDILSNNCFEVLQTLKTKYIGEMVYSANFYVSTCGKIRVQCREKHESIFLYNSKNIWFDRIQPRTGNTLINKKIFDEVGMYHEDISFYEDMEFMLRFADKFKIVYSPVPVFTYIADSGGLSKKARPLKNELSYYVSFEEHGFYAKLILAHIIYASFCYRKKINDKLAKNYLIKRYRNKLLFILLSIFIRKVENLYYKIKK
jgi:glycosyltransferase involved in cell wall biosynthesis